jgi:hypothetical protein
MTELAERVCDAVGVVVDANMRVPGVDRIGPSLVRTIRANGEAMLLNMERDGRTLDTSLFSIIESGDIART